MPLGGYRGAGASYRGGYRGRCLPLPSRSLRIPSPPLLLRSRSPQIQLGDLGSAVSSRAGSEAKYQLKSKLVLFCLRIGGGNFNDFTENQLPKFRVV